MRVINKNGDVLGEVESHGWCLERTIAVEDYVVPELMYEIVVYNTNDELLGTIDKIKTEPTKDQILYALCTFGDIYSSKAYVNQYYGLTKEI